MIRKRGGGGWDKRTDLDLRTVKGGLQGSAGLQTVQREMMQYALNNIGRLFVPLHGGCRSGSSCAGLLQLPTHTHTHTHHSP